VLFLFVVCMARHQLVELRHGLPALPGRFGALIGIVLLVELLLVYSGWAPAPGAGSLAQVSGDGRPGW